MDTNGIIVAIQTALDEIEYRPEQGRRWWTRQVYIALQSAANQFPEVLVCAKRDSLPETDFSAWLWDFTWLVYQDGALNQDEEGNSQRNKKGLHNLADGSDNIISVPLVAESEWGDYYQILNDFDKLLVAGPNTLLRVMIYQRHNVPDKFELRLLDRIEQFDGTREGDTYQFVVYDRDGNRLWKFYKAEAKIGVDLIE